MSYKLQTEYNVILLLKKDLKIKSLWNNSKRTSLWFPILFLPFNFFTT